MKKFFEMPVVEITVFDVEDVISTSVAAGPIDTADVANKAAVDAVIADINDNGAWKSAGYDAAEAYKASYNW